MAAWENDLIYVVNGTRYDVLPRTRCIAYEVADAALVASRTITRVIGATTWYQHDGRLSLDFVGNAFMQRWIRDYVIANERRLNVEYVINNHRMWRTYAKRDLRDSRGRNLGDFAAKTWAPYGPQADGAYVGTDNPHTDHVHVTLYPGDYTAPSPAPRATLVPEPHGKQVALSNLRSGQTHADVVALQKALIRFGAEIPAGATGFYGDQTTAAVRAFQRSLGWTPDGVVGPLTASRLALTPRTGYNTRMTTHAAPADTQLTLRNPEPGEDGVAVLEAVSRELGSNVTSTVTVRLTLDELALLADGFKSAYRRARRAR